MDDAREIGERAQAFAHNVETLHKAQSLDGGLIGFEALVRWQHPQLGLISPAQFLPAAGRNCEWQ